MQYSALNLYLTIYLKARNSEMNSGLFVLRFQKNVEDRFLIQHVIGSCRFAQRNDLFTDEAIGTVDALALA